MKPLHPTRRPLERFASSTDDCGSVVVLNSKNKEKGAHIYRVLFPALFSRLPLNLICSAELNAAYVKNRPLCSAQSHSGLF